MKAEAVDILSVSAWEEDHDELERIFECTTGVLRADYRWRLQRSATIKSAITTLKRKRIPIPMFEHDLGPGTWVDMLDQLALLPEAPCMIVCSRSADERLWAEVLNRGAFDLPLRPFDATEVVRVLNWTWLHWKHRRPRASTASSMPRAAGSAVRIATLSPAFEKRPGPGE